MRIIQIGNFQPGTPEDDKHSTENHLLRALKYNAQEVKPLQENVADTWLYLDRISRNKADRPDFVLWTRTWDQPEFNQRRIVAQLKAEGIPVVGYHLDRWWGLERETQINEQAFFSSSIICTADGGHDAEWKEAGITHWWYPPGVSLGECRRVAYPDVRYMSDLAFVGSWLAYSHGEWQYRVKLNEFLRDCFGSRFKQWPEYIGPGRVGEQIRGQDLSNLYRSTKVLVGDSCLAGGATHYCSDRVPETLGRGGFLIHPEVEGVTDGTLYEAGSHLAVYRLGDFEGLANEIERWIASPELRNEIARSGRQHVLQNYTYEALMRKLILQLVSEGIVVGPEE